MNIDVVTVAHNEEKMIKYFIEHYLPTARTIYILDHDSTDDTVKIATSYGDKVKVFSVLQNQVFNEFIHVNLKKQFSRQLDADFVIACDTDEFIFPRNFTEILIDCKNKGITVPTTIGYHMVNENFDFASDIYSITAGYRDPHFDKKIVFNPKVDIQWSLGQHFAYPHLSGDNYKESLKPLLELRHYKYINRNYVLNKNKVVSARVDKAELAMGINYHYSLSEKEQNDYFNKLMEGSIQLS